MDRPEVNDTLGWVYYKKGLASLAIAPFQQSLGKDPDNPVYNYHLGLAYNETGETVKAREALERALKAKAPFAGADEARRVLASLQD